MRLDTLFLACALGAAALPTFAAPVSGSTSGVWIHPTPSASPVVTSGVGTSSFSWGDSDGAPQNNVRFAATAGGFNSVTETAFKVGTLTYFNGTTATGTDPASVQLALTLDFLSPAIPSVTSDYTFNIETTPNTGSASDNADILELPSAFSTTSFVIGGVTYDVKLTGFSNIHGDGFLTSNDLALHVEEGRSASADLFAEVTTQVSSVPEPQNMALMLAALGAMGVVARRRRS